MGRRDPDRYAAADRQAAGRTVGAMRANRWRVDTECELCELRIRSEFERIRGLSFRI